MSIEMTSEGRREAQEPSGEDRSVDQNSREESTWRERDKHYSDVDRSDEELRQLKDKDGDSHQHPTSHLVKTRQEQRDRVQEQTDPNETRRADDRMQGPIDESYEKNDFIRDQISKLSADMFKLDEPLFDEEQPPLNRVEIGRQWRGNDDGDGKYNIDEIVDKVRERLREDFERHGYGYLLNGAKNKQDVIGGKGRQQGEVSNDAQKNKKHTNYHAVGKGPDSYSKERGEVYNYAQNKKKQSLFQHGEEKRHLLYTNQEKREVFSQENVRNERPGSRFQILNQPNLAYESHGTAREIDLVKGTNKGPAARDDDIPEVHQKQETDMFQKKLIGKKGQDSYEDYQIPKKESNIYASEEGGSAHSSNREPRHKSNQGGGAAPERSPLRPAKRVKPTADQATDYPEITMADTKRGLHAVTEIMKWDYDAGTLKERSVTRARTVLPTKKRFSSVSPNYYISQPTVVERYDFEEPVPLAEQVGEDHGPRVGLADIGDITINNRKNKRLRMTS